MGPRILNQPRCPVARRQANRLSGVGRPRPHGRRDADYTLTLSPNTGKQFNIAYIIDVSGSMRGAPLDDAQTAYRRFTQALIDNGIAAHSQFAVIPFNHSASLSSSADARATIATLRTLKASGGTRFDPALEQAVNFFHTASPNATNLAYFLSDGSGSGASSLLQAYADVQAYAIGSARLDQLDLIDSDTAVQLTDSDNLFDAFASTGLAAPEFTEPLSDYDLSADDIAQIEILVGDRVVETIQSNQLVQGPTGLSYQGSLKDLDVSIDAKNAVTARVTLTDGHPQSTVATNINSGAVSLDSSSPPVATDDDDLIILDPIAETVDGLEGDDLILGNSRFNTIAGGASNDEIHAGDGDDIIDPGAGNDIVDGGDGIDIVTYNRLTEDAGLICKVGDWLHLADAEVDTLTGVEFVQFADGWLNTDTLRTSDSVQIRDQLLGSMRRDQLVGTDEDEELLGLWGSDILTGGAGADRFVYREFRDIGDVVTDFEVGQDLIDLSQMMVSLGVSGADAFAGGFVDIQGFSGGTAVLLDRDGTATGEFVNNLDFSTGSVLYSLRNPLPPEPEPQPTPPGAGESPTTSVPEAHSWLMLAAAAIGLVANRNSRK